MKKRSIQAVFKKATSLILGAAMVLSAMTGTTVPVHAEESPSGFEPAAPYYDPSGEDYEERVAGLWAGIDVEGDAGIKEGIKETGQQMLHVVFSGDSVQMLLWEKETGGMEMMFSSAQNYYGLSYEVGNHVKPTFTEEPTRIDFFTRSGDHLVYEWDEFAGMEFAMDEEAVMVVSRTSSGIMPMGLGLGDQETVSGTTHNQALPGAGNRFRTPITIHGGMLDGQTIEVACNQRGAAVPSIGTYSVSIQFIPALYEALIPDGYGTTWTQHLGKSGLFINVFTAGAAQNLSTFIPMDPPPPPKGYVRVQKGTSNPSITDGNPMYSLGGAVYDIHNIGGDVVAQLTTDESGATGLAELDPGDYYITESVPSPGHKIDNTRYDFNVSSGNTADTPVVVNSTEPVASDPPWMVLRKLDKLTGGASPLGDGTLGGARYQLDYWNNSFAGGSPTRSWVYQTNASGVIFFANGSYLVSGVPYTNPFGEITFPLGTYRLQEISAPTGYLIDPATYEAIVSQDELGGNAWFHWRNAYTGVSYNETDGMTHEENIIMGGVSIDKWDQELMRKNPQGDASLVGAVFEIINRSANPVRVNGTDYGVGQSVLQFSTNAEATATTANNVLPYGTYEIREVTASTGYNNLGVTSRTFSVRNHLEVVQMNTAGTAILEQVKRGGVEVQKWDYEINARRPQGDGNLVATVEIYNRSAQEVLVANGDKGAAKVSYAVNEKIKTVTLDASGIWRSATDWLPYGTYEVKEITPPEGYLTVGGKLNQTFTIRNEGTIEVLDGNRALKNYVKRGGVEVQKWDYEINAHQSQGSGNLAATVEIYNRSAQEVLVANGDKGAAKVSYAVNEKIKTVTLDASGTWRSATDWLPYGSYEVKEITPPEGYLTVGGKLNQTFTIRTEGEIEVLDGNRALKNHPKRGDIEFVKVAGTSMERLANVPFEIILYKDSARTIPLEKHVIVTDDNGEATTVSSSGVEWSHLHGTNTNRGLTSDDGIWFGNITKLDEKLGALLYGYYTLQELSCPANVGLDLISVDFRISRHDSIVNLGTLDDPEPKELGIGTTAYDDETDMHLAYVSEKTANIDTVEYWGLTRGKNYTMYGKLYDKATGNPLIVDGNEVSSEINFVAKTEDGTVDVSFLFDSSGMEGMDVVVFEQLYDGDVMIASHEDIEDEGQTVTFENPQIGTSAKEKSTGSNFAYVSDKTTIVDTVTYTGLIPKKEYTISGVLMDKETGLPVMVDGIILTATKTFVAKTEDGSVDIEFTFNSRGMEGSTVVAFESLYFGGRIIASHEDIEDEEQSVEFANPTLKTTATDKDTGTHKVYATKDAAIIDMVEYSGLIPGREYTLKGILMDKKTGQSLKQGGLVFMGYTMFGGEITAEIAFTPDSESGIVEVAFAYDGTGLEDQTIVVFESLYDGGILVTAHEDIDDVDQSVSIANPVIGTNLTGEGGAKVVKLDESVVLYDVVSYSDLIPGREYTLKGWMENASDNDYLVANSTVTQTFIPETADGTVTMQFVINTLPLEDDFLVAMEELYVNGILIAEHKDLTDADQTVQVDPPSIGTTLTGEDGSHEVKAGGKVKLTDTVEYKSLNIGSEYVLKGILMDKTTNKPLIIGGNEVTAETTFVADAINGTAVVSFEFDGNGLAEKSVVAFEELYRAGTIIADHKDIDDEGQTVTFGKPSIGTTLTGEDGSHEVKAGGKVKLTDTIEYKSLNAGSEYVLNGILMDKATKRPLIIGGSEVTAETTFIPETADGTAVVTFEFNSKGLTGKSVVAFEELYLADTMIADHKDINDADQTVVFADVPPAASPAPAPKPKTPNPKTGDGNTFYIWLVIAGFSGAALIGHSILRKKRKNLKKG